MKNMRNLAKLLFSRVVLISLAIILQLVFLSLGFTRLREFRRWIYIAMTALSWLTVLYIISKRSNPSYKIAWIILILVFPVFGMTFYLFLGRNKLSGRDNRKMQKIFSRNAPLLSAPQPQISDLTAKYHSDYLRRVSSFGAYFDSSAEYFSCGEDCFEKMLDDLKAAKRSIYLEFFILAPGKLWDGILDVLTEKARQGVDVRVIFDDFGCIRRLPAFYSRRLRRLGIQAYAFSPYLPIASARLNNRDHRKLMIIDGTIGYTGGVNLADEYANFTSPLGYWKDCALRIEGNAVWSMSVMFLAMWQFVSKTETSLQKPSFVPKFQDAGLVQPFCDTPLDEEDVSATEYLNLIHHAHRSLYIMTPYLVLDESMSNALCSAAKAGVDVRIVTPSVPDKWYVHAVTRANYNALLCSGVRIFEYLPGFLHAKVCLVDGAYAMVGTVNLDYRSLYLHYEDAVFLHAGKAVSQIEADFSRLFPQCREITPDDQKQVSFWRRLLRNLLRLFSPLM